MPRCILLAEYAHGVLRLQEKSACLVLVDGHAFFFMEMPDSWAFPYRDRF